MSYQDEELTVIIAKLDAIVRAHDTRYVAAAMITKSAVLYQALRAAGVNTMDETREIFVLAFDKTMEPCPPPTITAKGTKLQ